MKQPVFIFVLVWAILATAACARLIHNNKIDNEWISNAMILEGYDKKCLPIEGCWREYTGCDSLDVLQIPNEFGGYEVKLRFCYPNEFERYKWRPDTCK